MARTISYTEPHQANAGEIGNWMFVFSPGQDLQKGARLKFDLLSNGRDIDWEIPSTNLKKGEAVIFAKTKNGKILLAKEVEVAGRFAPQFEFTLTEKLPSGEEFTICVGSPKSNGERHTDKKNGVKAQSHSQRRRPFYLYVDAQGKGRFDDPEVFHIDIKGGPLQNIRVLSPSFVIKNKRFDITLRFEDQHGNLTNNAPEETLIELSYEQLRENLNWKLFVPETGFITLPNLYFNEEGTYTISLKNRENNETFASPPIRCFAEPFKNLYWGLLHGESDKFDSTENIEACLRHFRDEKAFHFFASSPFEEQEETPLEVWKSIIQNVAEFDESDRFTPFAGFQWEGEPQKEGLREFIYLKDGKQILRKKDIKNSSLDKIYKSFSPKELLSIPSFTMAQKHEYDFKNFDPTFERVVEIYNAWGSSECTKKEGNIRPIHSLDKNGVNESAIGSIREALKKNLRFGFVAGGLDDRGTFAPFYEGEQVQYTPGLTAILATEHTKGALAEALYQRACYATTGEKMLVGFTIVGSIMGSELNTLDKHGLNVNRHIAGYVAGTAPLVSVEIIRNGEVIHKITPTNTYHLDFTFDDLCDLKSITLDAKDKKPPFVFYYLKVTQEGGHMAWSSPIWIDYIPGKPIGKRPLKAGTKAIKPLLNFEEEDPEEEEEDDLLENDDV